jgi:hypothetical protein
MTLMDPDYEQSIVVDDNYYVAKIKIRSQSTITEEGLEPTQIQFVLTIINDNDSEKYELLISGDEKRIKQIQNALSHKEFLSYSAKFIDDKQKLRIDLNHPSIDFDGSYILERYKNKETKDGMIELRLSNIESKYDKEYFITNDMMGEMYRVNDLKMDIDSVRKLIDKKVNVSDGYDKLFRRIETYYDISYVHQDHAPKILNNQYIIPGKFYINRANDDRCSITQVENLYTIVKKKHAFDYVGIITKNNNEVKIHTYFSHDELDSKNEFKYLKPLKSKVSPDFNENWYCDRKTYFDKCYFLELPFYVKNGVYISNWYYGNSPILILIENRKIYLHIEDVEQEKYFVRRILQSEFSFKIK